MSNVDFERVTCILPALNEETSISATIEQLQSILPGSHILVIDNGSTDRTAELAESLGAAVTYEARRGKGFAVRRGLQLLEDSCKVVFLVDADDTYGVEELPIAITALEKFGYGMIVGTRVASDNKNKTRKPAFRPGHVFGNYFISKLSKSLSPTGIEDSLSGWRLMSRGFVNSFNSNVSGFEIEAELNAHAYLLECSVSNWNIKYRGRRFDSNSKLQTYQDAFRIIKRSFKLFKNNRPLLAFNILAFPWLIVSVWLIIRALANYLTTGLLEQFPSLIAGVGAFIISGMLWVCGMILQRIKLLRVEIAQINYRRFS